MKLDNSVSLRILSKIHRYLALLPMIVILSGCVDQRTAEEKKDTLVYGYNDVFKTFDPARQVYAQETAIIQQVLEPLVIFNNDLELTPRLATHWESQDDCYTWVFQLRENVEFHDGTPFNAAAAKSHFERIMDPATAATRAKYMSGVERVEAPDEHTLIFRMKEPNCVFVDNLSAAWASIPSPTALKERGDEFSRNPVGTGPFEFVEWIPDTVLRLKKNQNYWNAENYFIERLEFKPVPENTTRLILLEQGVIDIADIFFAHVQAAKKTDDLEIQTTNKLAIRYIGFNTQKPPFDNKLVRQAANYAVNKEAMVEHMFFGVGDPAKGPLPPVLPAFNEDIEYYDYNPEKAKELLKEAGYPEDYVADMWTRESGLYRSAADAAVGDLRDLGMNINMITLDNGVYWSKFDEFLTRDGRMYPTKDGVYDIYVGGWVGGERAHFFLEPLFRSYSYSNSSFFMNDDVDQMIKDFKAETDPEKRDQMLKDLQAIIVEEAPWVFAFHDQMNVGVQKRVKNYTVNPSGLYFFEGVKVVDE